MQKYAAWPGNQQDAVIKKTGAVIQKQGPVIQKKGSDNQKVCFVIEKESCLNGDKGINTIKQGFLASRRLNSCAIAVEQGPVICEEEILSKIENTRKKISLFITKTDKLD